ncbi:hypothetical protein C8A01DRAFT_40773 [Parachaetomium inaequale]|uniref:Uncharacterized protein n=1 Tax=Parachaetomium inaequale TaxID=2588326 RepID=A0AAN6SMH7_9PEZI|nr:hypothetical protein C8A01DRAFT_40773 [Parachaetomium inaequale]
MAWGLMLEMNSDRPPNRVPLPSPDRPLNRLPLWNNRPPRPRPESNPDKKEQKTKIPSRKREPDPSLRGGRRPGRGGGSRRPRPNNSPGGNGGNRDPGPDPLSGPIGDVINIADPLLNNQPPAPAPAPEAEQQGQPQRRAPFERYMPLAPQVLGDHSKDHSKGPDSPSISGSENHDGEHDEHAAQE